MLPLPSKNRLIEQPVIRPSVRLAGVNAWIHGVVAETELRSLGLDPAQDLDFSVSTNPLGPSPRVRDAISRVPIDRYPDDQALAFRHALSRRLGIGVECVLAGNGSAELIWLTALAFLDPGDNVLVVGPTFDEYERAAHLMGAGVTRLAAGAETSFRPDVATICERIGTLRPKLVFVCNPNNPTGVQLARRDLAAILDTSRYGLLIVDEAYAGLAASQPPMIDLVESGRLMLLRSLTKDHGLAGLRLGYAVAAPALIGALNQVRPPWSVSAVAQAAGLAALEDDEHLARSRAEIDSAKTVLREGLERLGYPVVPSAANFLLVEVGDGARMRRLLLERGYCVRDAASFGLPAYVRIGIRTCAECQQLLAAFAAIREAGDAS